MKKPVLLLMFATPLLASGIAQPPAGFTAVTFSATPTYTCPAQGASSFYILLTANITSSTLAGCSPGTIVTWMYCQDGTGTRTVVPPANVFDVTPVDPTAHYCTTQAFRFDGTNARSLGQGVVTKDDGSAINGALTLRSTGGGSFKLTVLSGMTEQDVAQMPATAGVAGQALFTDGNNPATYSWQTPSGTPPTPSGTALISGGSVAWAGGLNFVVQAATYTINGTQYTSAQTTLTLVADGTNARIDVIVLDNTGAATFLAGTPGVNPAAPVPDPSSQLALTFVYIAAGAGVPSNIASTLIYDENVGGPTEWTTTVSGAGMNAASVTNPYHLTKDVEATAATTGQYVQFQAGSPFSLSTSNALVFYIRSKAAWASSRSLQLVFQNAGAQVGSIMNFANGSYGFASSNTTGYQQIVIPLNLFNTFGTNVNQLKITVSGTGGSLGFYLDYVQLQSGLTGLPGTFLTWKGTWNATTGYNQNDVVIASGTPYVALAANVNSTPPSANWAAMVATTRSCVTASFDGAGSPLTAGKTVYATLPAAGTIVAWNILGAGATGTNTIKVWRIATGTALPTVANSINTSGVSLTTGTAVHSTTLTDFTSTALVAHDILGVNLLAVDGAVTYLNFSLECQ